MRKRKAIVGVLAGAILGTGIGYTSAPAPRPSPCESTSLSVGTYVRLPDGSRGHIADTSPAGKAIGYVAIDDDGGWTDFIRECDVDPILTADEATLGDDDEPL